MPSGTAGPPWKEGAVSHRGGFLQNYKKTEQAVFAYSVLVRLRGLEPLPVSGMEPKSIVYTNFTTSADKLSHFKSFL